MPGADRNRVAEVLDAVREALGRLAGLFGPRPILVPIPVRVATPAERRRAVLESLRNQRR
ncbi:MAG: hypothetical protein ACRDX8_06720 [Acidimicrobiales bacterium]